MDIPAHQGVPTTTALAGLRTAVMGGIPA